MSLIWVIFAVNFLWFIGDGLEHAWGAFKLNAFYLFGMVGCTVGAFYFPGRSANGCLNLTLLFAFATIYPEEIIYMFFIIPMKMKWLGYISFAFEMLQFIGGSTELQIAVLASLGNYILFFYPMLIDSVRHRHQVTERRRRFEAEKIDESEPLHRCSVCKRTEITIPNSISACQKTATNIAWSTCRFAVKRPRGKKRMGIFYPSPLRRAALHLAELLQGAPVVDEPPRAFEAGRKVGRQAGDDETGGRVQQHDIAFRAADRAVEDAREDAGVLRFIAAAEFGESGARDI